jgi:hypothetical protein
MTWNVLQRTLIGCGWCLIAAGCSQPGDEIKLAAVDGTVTYKGAALAGATVTFVPEKGPLAIGTTDLSGKFVLSSGTLKGAAVGPAKASVVAGSPKSDDAPKLDSAAPKTPEEAQAFFNKAGDMQRGMSQGTATAPKSIIPERYGRMDSSGLSFTVNANGDNHFPIELKD